MKTIVLGPPGTGKTTTLLNLVDQFIQQGVRPKQIGYFSFTRKFIKEPSPHPTSSTLVFLGINSAITLNSFFIFKFFVHRVYKTF